jgi:hypothetical protein
MRVNSIESITWPVISRVSELAGMAPLSAAQVATLDFGTGGG